MKQSIGVFFFTITIVAVLVNSALMLLSPKLWFRMPPWIRLSNLPEGKFKDGWGGIQIRLLGAILLGVIIWFAHGFFYTR